jgi:hypothetical protein
MPTLTDAEIASFHERGHVRVRAAFPRGDALAMQELLWQELRERNGVRRDDPATWDRSWDGLKPLARRPIFRRIASERLRGAIDDLLGADTWTAPTSWNMFRVSPPDRSPQRWRVPTEGWHWDAPPDPRTGLMLFVFYSQVRERGGGTLFVEGAHRLISRFCASMGADLQARSFAEQKRRFGASHPWLARLTGAAPRASEDGLELLREERDADGIPLRVVEAHGEPGDVVICHGWCYHNKPSQHEGEPRALTIKGLRPRVPVDLEALYPDRPRALSAPSPAPTPGAPPRAGRSRRASSPGPG